MKKKPSRRVETPEPLETRIALGIAFVLAPLVWTRAAFSLFVLPKLVLSAVAVALAGIGALRTGEPNGKAGRSVEASLAALWVVLAASTAFSVDPYLSLFGRYNDYAYGLLAMALYSAAFLWGAGMSDAHRRRFSSFAIAGGALVGFVGILQILGFRPGLQFELPGGRAVSTIGSPVHLGAYLAACLILAVPREGDSGRGRRWLCAALIAGGVIASFSRGAWLSAGFGAAIAFGLEPFLFGKTFRGRRTMFALSAAALIAATAFGVSRFRSVGKSDSLRMEAWRSSASIVKSHPLLGSGPDTFGVEFRKLKSVQFVRTGGATLRHEYAHNDLLQAATTTGLLGFGLYLAFLVFFAKELSARWGGADGPARARSLRFAGAAAAVFAAAKFNPMSLEVSLLAATAAGAALSALGRVRSEDPRAATLRSCVFAGAGALAVAAAAWLFAGDAASQKGRTTTGAQSLQAHRRAVSINPCETQYARRYVNALMDLARENQTSPARFEYLDEARGVIARTLACRPASFEAHYAAGFVSVLEAQLGRPERISVALKEIDAARALDPTFGPLLELGATAAKTANDRERWEEFKNAALALRP